MRTRKQIDRAKDTHSLETAEGATCQDMETNRPSEGHSRAADGRGSDLSGHGNKSIERKTLTSWRRQRERLIRTRKQIDRRKETHKLETAEGATCQDIETNRRKRDTHFLETAEGATCQAHRNKSTERRTLTLWRRQRERLVRTQKQIDRRKNTHKLETAEGATCQDMETNRPREGNSLSGDGRGSDLSGHGNKSTKRRTLTLWIRQRERLVRTRKQIVRGKNTHFLETADRATCQDMETNRPREGHSRSGDGRGSDLSGHVNKSTEGRTLTSWRRQRERLVRTRKQIDRGKDTHFLETAEGATGQDMETNRPSEGHSLPGDGRGSDLSGHGNKLTERRTLTCWRRQRERLVRTRKQIDRRKATHLLETAEGATCEDTETNRQREGHSLPGDGRGSDL